MKLKPLFRICKVGTQTVSRGQPMGEQTSMPKHRLFCVLTVVVATLLPLVFTACGIPESLGPGDPWTEEYYAPFPYRPYHGESLGERYIPRWSPDGSLIAVTMAGEGTYLVRADGSEMWRLESTTDNLGVDISPGFSPNGSRLVYTTTKRHPTREKGRRDFDLETSAIDGSDRSRLTWTAASEVSPAWSPVGRDIAFIKWPDPNRGHTHNGLFAVGADGSSLRWLVDFATMLDPLVPRADAKVRCTSGPTWSPDGRRLAFVVMFYRYPKPQYQVLYTVHADGSGLKKLFTTKFDTSNHSIVSSPEWSPDGLQIAFLNYRPSGMGTRLYLVDPDGPGLARIDGSEESHVGVSSGNPREIWESKAITRGEISWSPDGSRILVSPAVEHSDVRLNYVVDLEGNSVEIAADAYSSWSPDGSRIATLTHLPILNQPNDRSAILSTMAPDGSDVQELAVSGPDGGPILASEAE